ncbi:MAG: alanyl-tRNA editing protein [Ktedonobacterales bacterium]
MQPISHDHHGQASPTERLYHTDSYASTCEAKVIAVDGNALALDRTIIYPGGGGQLADRGVLIWGTERMPLTGVHQHDDVIWHEIEPTSAKLPSIGDTVTCQLDWEFRYRMMRTHTALHILCGSIFRDFGVQVTGGQMYADRARMDFATDVFTPQWTRDIERGVNEAIAADYPIKVYTLPREQAFQIPGLLRTKINLLPPEIAQIRIVEIVGLDLQADGGTHVRSTREVGGIRVTKTENKGKQNKRMEIVLRDDIDGLNHPVF